MYRVKEEQYLIHYGVLGMKWGVRKKQIPNGEVDYKTESFTIKRGSDVHRISTVSNERHQGSGYASFKEEDAKQYRDLATIFSKYGGMQHYDLTFKAKKDLISPSQKTRIDVFLKKLKDPEFNSELKRTMARMFILNLVTPGDVKMALKYEDLNLNKARAYRMLNLAIAGNKKLRQQYLSEFEKLGYDIILDEADSTNKVSKAPIIFIERANSLEFVKTEKLG